jgi:predicted TIM-barrel fold metal-dependent hydrolase
MVASIKIPSGSWDSHLHCFDPAIFPFSATRAYTPQPAKLEDLVEQAHAENLMVVQASIEDGSNGLATHLVRCQREYPFRIIRGTIAGDVATLQRMPDEAYDRLHSIGVRSIRLHGVYTGPGQDIKWVQKQLQTLARLHPVQQHAWTVSAQLPLATWAALNPIIKTDPCLMATTFIADHCGSAFPVDIGSSQLAAFVDLLETGRLHVKVAALHRRSPADVKLMQPLIQLFARKAPHSLLWGSDWPHVNASKKGSEPQEPLAADTSFELRCLQSWLSEDEWLAMLVHNPARLFGN